MKITVRVDRAACVGCMNCCDILTPDRCREEKDHRGALVPSMERMPQMAYTGYEIRRLPADMLMILRDAVLECPGQALTIEE